MTRIKCCGMTQVDDALLAARLGADAIGVVLTARSRRQVSSDLAREIVAALPPFVASVALFMDDDADLVSRVIEEVRPTVLQFHGDETDDWCAQFGWPFIKALPMGGGTSARDCYHDYPRAIGLLLDGHAQGEAGGAGKAFDWSLLPDDLQQPLMLAGGLRSDTVGEAVRRARPWAVDVASGIESAPGIKDPQKLADFIRAVREADTWLAMTFATS